MDLKVLKSHWDRVLAVALALAGGISFIAGYAGVADSVLLAEQTRYIVAGGLGGVLLVGLGRTLWVSADLRDEWHKLDRIEHALADGVLRWSDGEEAPAAAPRRAAESAGADTVGNTEVLTVEREITYAHAANSREHA